MEFKDRLRSIRLSAGYKQKEFGKILGVSQQVISDLERGVSNPSNTLLRCLEYRYGDKEIGLDQAKQPLGSTISHEPEAYYPPEEEYLTFVRSLCVLFKDKDMARSAIKNLIYIEKLDGDKYDEILEKIFGAYVNLNHKKARD